MVKIWGENRDFSGIDPFYRGFGDTVPRKHENRTTNIVYNTPILWEKILPVGKKRWIMT
jgi:hypothetical protein